ncbi:MAG: hypothetical protein IKF78_04695 [Atopobiaceae bacterium]|nr:hypothetical protein [Atopobiaceae bacterium]
MGKEVIANLAQRFPQLYVAPAEDAQELHRMAAGRGIVIPDANLDHFVTSDEDELRVVDTPAGAVETVFLQERHDFETFLQIVGHRAQPVEILPEVGAITYFGLADWGAVARERERYEQSGGTDWTSEFRRLATQTKAFRCELVVLSAGPYSNVSYDRTPYDEPEWLRLSREIRLYHECAHVVCRRKMPKNIDVLWDELTADLTGLLFATGGYDVGLAQTFMGVSSDGYVGGRLPEYLDDEQAPHIDEVSVSIHEAIEKIDAYVRSTPQQDPFEILLSLKEKPLWSGADA